MRLIDADPFGVIFLQGKSEEFIEGVNFILDKIYEAPTVEERPSGEWVERGHYTYCSECGKECATLYDFCPYCGSDNRPRKRGLRAKMGLIDDAADENPNFEYLKVGDTIYTQDDDKQGWTGREENK